MSRGRRDGGQAAVELVLVLPLVLVLLLSLVQVGLLVRDQILVVHAAREAARTAAVDASPEAPRSAAVDSSGLVAARLELTVRDRAGPGSRVKVEATYRAPTDVPIVGRAVGDLRLRARAAMRVEGDTSGDTTGKTISERNSAGNRMIRGSRPS